MKFLPYIIGAAVWFVFFKPAAMAAAPAAPAGADYSGNDYVDSAGNITYGDLTNAL